jgi:DNA polymerase III psi subunit
MDLNHIELPASTVAELYRSSLVIPAEKKADAPTEVAPAIPKWLGTNKKNVLILVRHEDAIHLPDSDLELLTSILTACKLSLEDVAILNLFSLGSFDYKKAQQLFKPLQVVLFGIEPASIGLPLSFPHFQVQQFQQTSYLFSPTLSLTGSDRALKTALWQSLKLLFKL